MDRKYIITALCYAIVGMLLGIYMAASKNHGEMVTHAHIMLAGFVVSFIYGLCHKLWLGNNTSVLAQVQFYLHQVGVFGMCLGLFLLYGQFIALEKLDPILALSSIAVLIGMILMAVLFIKAPINSKSA
jgi:surface polysaccharide O-acyltransferase-like enzyme